jgi:hypothetical protein
VIDPINGTVASVVPLSCRAILFKDIEPCTKGKSKLFKNPLIVDYTNVEITESSNDIRKAIKHKRLN